MKVQCEISYILQSEPAEFTQVDTLLRRHVYTWEDRRGFLESEIPWRTFTRLSITEDQPDSSFMEIWSADNDISNPPHNADDMWIEDYKLIEKKFTTLEWHPTIKQLKIIWLQSQDTLKDGKIITNVMSEIENLKLCFPNFPHLTFTK